MDGSSRESMWGGVLGTNNDIHDVYEYFTFVCIYISVTTGKGS